MSEVKLPLMEGRLSKRLAALGLDSYSEYQRLLLADRIEHQHAIDLLTTNETFFFREPRHFDYLADNVIGDRRDRRGLRVWCAASSTGEEPYSIAMTLAQTLGHLQFDILASDISTRVLEKAQRAIYPVEDAAPIPSPMRRAWCLKGHGSQAGWFTVATALKQRVTFEQINLNQRLPDLGLFDVVFLRNVMIYFTNETKCAVVDKILRHLKPEGHLFVSHSETLNGLTKALVPLRPSVYRMPERP